MAYRDGFFPTQDPFRKRTLAGRQKDEDRIRLAEEMGRAEEEAIREALVQAQINEARRYEGNTFKGGLGSPFDNFSGQMAYDMETAQRRQAGAGGTLRILKNLPQGQDAKIADKQELGTMVHDARSLGEQVQEAGAKQFADREDLFSIPGIRTSQGRERELRARGRFSRDDRGNVKLIGLRKGFSD